MNVREAQAAMKQSGLPDNMMDTCTFDFWETPKQWQRNALDLAKEYVDKILHQDGSNQWFIMCGRPGCGKTRLCTTVFRSLVEGGIKGFYISWRDFARQAKSVANDGDKFSQLTSRAKKSRLIYIDDFWKGKVTAADVHLAFEILNDRYCSGKITILSSEFTLDGIASADEAISSRLKEMSRGYYLELSKADNWRTANK
jgi:DNA replication protein DnaC